MRDENKATLQELAKRIDQADAIVIGGGSAYQVRLDTTITIGLWHFQRHWLLFVNSMASRPHWLDSTIAFLVMGNSGRITANICVSCGKPLRGSPI